MSIFTIILISISLSIDCFAVSISSGIKEKHQKISVALKAAFLFGFFQAIMPLIGWSIGSSLKGFISSFDHWVAFGLLFIIGFRMITESVKNKDTKKIDLFNNRVLLLLSIATSIDALIVGITFAFLKVDILFSVAIIGLITFLISILGFMLGKKLSFIFAKKGGIIAGIVIILIGTKILLEHLL